MKPICVLMAVFGILIFLASAVSAVDYLYIEFNQVGEKMLVKEVINFDNESEIQLDIPEDARAVSVSTDYMLDNDLLKARGKNIEISYITNENLEKVKSNYYFIDKLEFGFDIQKLEIKLILDEGFVVDKEDIFPKPTLIGTDGRTISISWEFEDFKKEDNIPIFVVLTDIGQDFDIYLVLAVFLIVLVLLISYFYFVRRKSVGKGAIVKKRRASKLKERDEIEAHLLESEKAVINELKKADKNELWQKQLQLKTGFSKAKLSRVVRNLESRNLIRKIPLGNTNKVKLK